MKNSPVNASNPDMVWAGWIIWLALVVAATGLLSYHQFNIPSNIPCPPGSEGEQLASEPTKDSSTAAKGRLTSGAGSMANDIPPASLNSRKGFGMSTLADPSEWANKLDASWYLDWRVQLRRSFQMPEHWQMVRIMAGCAYPSGDYIFWTAEHFPGQVWIIGNEPDVIWQDSTPPELYARIYHDLYQLIKAADSSARIAPAGIAQATPLRLSYLDRVLAYYQKSYGVAFPADLWTVHGYVLREERGSWGVEIPPGMAESHGRLYDVSDHGRLDIFQEQIIAFRKWMATNGYQDTPLALTEFGIAMPADYGFPDEVIVDYLRGAIEWLGSARDFSIGYPEDNDRLVQRWAWFSLSDPLYPAPNLADLQLKQLTVIGKAYQAANPK